MPVPWWLFGLVLAWAVLTTAGLFWRNPLPIPDRGHRCFGVPSERAARAAGEVIAAAGLPIRFTFETGANVQTLFWDNNTVLIRHLELPTGVAPSGISLPVAKPIDQAKEAARHLLDAGFSATVTEDHSSVLAGKLAIVSSDAFMGWVLVFRPHILALETPRFVPNP